MADDRPVELAKHNLQSTFEKVFEQELKDIAATCYEQNEEFFVCMCSDEEFMSEVIKLMLPEVYRRLRRKKGKSLRAWF